MGLLSGVVSLFGLNTPTPPTNPLGAMMWRVFRDIANMTGLTPQAGIPTVGAPDSTTGVVTGTLEFTEPAGLPLTYSVTTNPTQGSVTISSAGAYTYTPTNAARLAPGTTTTPVRDTFTVAATDGVAATAEIVTVPVLALAGVPVTVPPTSGAGLPPLWNQSPPPGTGPAPTGTVYASGNGWDTAVVANNQLWDNFDGAANSAINSTMWTNDTSNSGGSQVYQTANVYLDGNGNAVLHGYQSGGKYYSGRFDSKSKWNIQYGYLAARIKMPNVAGALPAFWALMDGVGVSSIPYAEYDIMELFGKGTTMNTHLWYNSANTSAGNLYADTEVATPSEFGGNLANGYHTYWMNWQPNSIEIGVDDYIMGTWTPASIGANGQPIGSKWAPSFNQPAWVILNFAIGGFGWMNPSTPQPGDLPANMSVDWVWYVPLSQMSGST